MTFHLKTQKLEDFSKFLHSTGLIRSKLRLIEFRMFSIFFESKGCQSWKKQMLALSIFAAQYDMRLVFYVNKHQEYERQIVISLVSNKKSPEGWDKEIRIIAQRYEDLAISD